jgi:hypothetical protein
MIALNDQLSAVVEALQRARDRECEQQTHQTEYRALESREPSAALNATALAIPQAKVLPQMI